MKQDDIEIKHLMQMCGSYKYDTQEMNRRVINSMKRHQGGGRGVTDSEKIRKEEDGPYEEKQQEMFLINGIE
jgi:hypothetical protein